MALLAALVLATGCYKRPQVQQQAPAAERPAPVDPAEVFPFHSFVGLPPGVQNLNVRDEPSIHGGRVFQLAADQEVVLTEERGGWFHVQAEAGQKEGWAFGAYLDLSPYTPMASHAAGPDGLTLFTGPSLTSEPGEVLKEGGRYLTVGGPSEDGWLTVLQPDGTKLYTR